MADTGGVGQRTPEVRIGEQLAAIAVVSSTSNIVTYNATHTLSGTAVAEGALSYAITAYDNAGNDQTSSGTSTIIYDRTGPTIGTFNVTSINPTNSVHASVSVNATDSRSGVDEYKISGNVQTEITSSSTGTINFALSSGDGNKTITLTVTDAVGNYATMNRTIVLDQTGPVISSFTLPSATREVIITTGVAATDSLGEVSNYQL